MINYESMPKFVMRGDEWDVLHDIFHAYGLHECVLCCKDIDQDYEYAYEGYAIPNRFSRDEFPCCGFICKRCRNKMIEQPPIPQKEMHVWIYKAPNNIDITPSYNDTLSAVHYGKQIIHTYVTHFFNFKYLALYGYRLFVHVSPTRVEEAVIGENPWTDRVLREEHHLEKLLLNGEFNH